MFPEESISSLEVACQTWPVFDVQLMTGQQNKWVGMLAWEGFLCPSLLPLPPLPNFRSKQKYYFFLIFSCYEEKGSLATLLIIKFNFSKQATGGGL